MDDADLEKITERVRKLFALAARNPSEAEAASAAAKAQELLAASGRRKVRKRRVT